MPSRTAFHPCALGRTDLGPSIVWVRAGRAISGDPPEVYRVTVYRTEDERNRAWFAARGAA